MMVMVMSMTLYLHIYHHFIFNNCLQMTDMNETSIWWDVDNCAPPAYVINDCTGQKDRNYDIVDNICSAINKLGLQGAITINMFGMLEQSARKKIYASRRRGNVVLVDEQVQPSSGNTYFMNNKFK